MATTAPWNISPYMKECMAQADPQKKPVSFKIWMAGRNFSLQIKWHTSLMNGGL